MSDEPYIIPTTLIGLLEHYSPTGSEEAAVGWLLERMRALGFDRSYRDEAGNVVGVIGQGPRQLILLGHIDTVPGEIPIRVEGERLFGRGAVDAKGPLAAFVDAAAAVTPQPGWQVIVIGAVDEEGDSGGARWVVGKYTPEYAIIGEPSGWDRITLGYKGNARAEIRVQKPQAHTAMPRETACEAVVGIWQAVRRWADSFNQDKERLFDQVQPSLLNMESGRDGFKQWARLQVGARLPLDLPPEAWYRELLDLAGEADVLPKGFAVQAYQAQKNCAPVRGFLAAIRAAGGSPGFVLKTGTADLNIVAPAWGCPAVAYGPGDSRLDHTPDEHILLSEYARSVAVLQGVVRGLTK